MNPIPGQMARLSRMQGLDGRTIRQLLSRRFGETLRVSSTKSRRAEGLPAHRGLNQFHRGPGSRGLKGRRTSVPKHCNRRKDPLLGQPRETDDQASDEKNRNDPMNLTRSCTVIFSLPRNGTSNKVSMTVTRSLNKAQSLLPTL